MPLSVDRSGTASGSLACSRVSQFSRRVPFCGMLGTPVRLAASSAPSIPSTTLVQLLVNHQESQWSIRCGNHQAILLSSRHEMIGAISQLILNACTDCDMYERRARYRKSLKLRRLLLAHLTSDSRRSLARASRAWPSVLQRRFATAFGETTRRTWLYP